MRIELSDQLIDLYKVGELSAEKFHGRSFGNFLKDAYKYVRYMHVTGAETADEARRLDLKDVRQTKARLRKADEHGHVHLYLKCDSLGDHHGPYAIKFTSGVPAGGNHGNHHRIAYYCMFGNRHMLRKAVTLLLDHSPYHGLNGHSETSSALR